MLIFIITSIILLLIIALSFYFSNIVIYPKVKKYIESYNIEIKNGKIDEEAYNRLKKEELYLTSPYNYKIHGIYISNNNSKRTMIFCHGLTFSLYSSVKYIDMFYKRGFNIFIYDHRNHGRSGGNNTTYGFFEKFDLKACTDWVFNRCGVDSIVGIHGEALGAATVLLNSAIDERVSFYIADSSFSNLSTLLNIRLKEDYKLPAFPLIYISSYISKIKAGFYYKEVNPINEISKVTTPIFFIHGMIDTYIPHEMSIDMYNTKPGIRKLYIAKNADHAEAFWNNKKEYEEKIEEFLREINIL